MDQPAKRNRSPTVSPPDSPICEGMVAPAAKKAALEPKCFGCKHNKASQKHHMGDDGCLEQEFLK